MVKAPALDMDLLQRLPWQQGHIWQRCWQLAAGTPPCKASRMAMAGKILDAEALGSQELAAHLARWSLATEKFYYELGAQARGRCPARPQRCVAPRFEKQSILRTGNDLRSPFQGAALQWWHKVLVLALVSDLPSITGVAQCHLTLAWHVQTLAHYLLEYQSGCGGTGYIFFK